MKILIIGGSRFVGPALIKILVGGGHDVTVFNRGNIQSDYGSTVKFIKGDRNTDLKVPGHFDAVIDTCARSGANTTQAIEGLDFDYFLNFSTVAVYKKPDVFPITEESAVGPWPIWGERGKNKLDCELALNERGIKHANIRPVFILGPKNYVDRENFIYSRIKKGEPLILPGNGEAIVQFVFSQDVAKSIAMLATKKITGAFNCAGQSGITLNQLVAQMGAIVGKEPIIKYNPENDGAKWKEAEFPFPNENMYFKSEKLQKLGIEFTPFLEGLRQDYDSYYKALV